jgi:hypothetical protein
MVLAADPGGEGEHDRFVVADDLAAHAAASFVEPGLEFFGGDFRG